MAAMALVTGVPTKSTGLCLAIFLSVITVMMVPLPAQAAVLPGGSDLSSKPLVAAEAAVLIDVASGRVLFAKNPEKRLYPASTTKILTALVVLDQADPDEPVTTSKAAASIGGSSIYLTEGEVLSVGDLLQGLLLASGNDAAVALAEHVAGTVEDFALLMNRAALALGANDSNFRNPHGLHDPAHFTSAHDLALMTRAGLSKYPMFRETVAKRASVIPWPDREWDRALYNHNRLLWRYEGADGVKTGYTRNAGNCLVASATRAGWQLAAVILESGDHYQDAERIFDYGFGTYSPGVVAAEGLLVRTVTVRGGEQQRVTVAVGQDLIVPLLPGEAGKIRLALSLPERIEAPVQEGTGVGELLAYLDGERVGSAPLVATEAIPKGTLLTAFLRSFFRVFRALLGQG